jgi:hypothetical protein
MSVKTKGEAEVAITGSQSCQAPSQGNSEQRRLVLKEHPDDIANSQPATLPASADRQQQEISPHDEMSLRQEELEKSRQSLIMALE